MSGHSKWSKVKHQKAATDAKKGKTFSKLVRFIALAAKKGADPEANPSLKFAISQARAVNMPSENIERAIKKGSGEMKDENLEEARYESFGPNGIAIIIETISNNKNRTLNEIKHLLSQYNIKLAEQGSVLWTFSKDQSGEWQPKHTVQIPETDKETVEKLLEILEDHEDVQKVYTNAANL